MFLPIRAQTAHFCVRTSHHESDILIHGQQNLLSLLYIAFRTVLVLPICGLAYAAVGVALRQRQKEVLKWLIPVALGHTLAALFFLYDWMYRLFHLKPSLASLSIGYGIEITSGFLSLYVAWRIYLFVCNGWPKNGVPNEPEEGVWPPPPTRTG